MRSIPLLAVEAETIFDDIAAAKQKRRRVRMKAVRAKVLASYQSYEDATPEVGGLSKAVMTTLQKDAMRHAFNVETKPMEALRGDMLKRVAVARCPFCGISESTTLDHYLPKEQYPEFAIFPKNLVPCCSHCNTKKRDRIVDAGTDVRMFLHPCYDIIPDEEFIQVRTRMAENALILSYRVVRPEGMQQQTFLHLRSHFTELGLADRYRLMGLDHLGSQYPSLRRAYGKDADADRVAEKLSELAGDFEDVAGPNYWLAKLYRALSENEDFCDGGFESIKVEKVVASSPP
ncbi:HNH endonuclease signature motif containing protein [Rhizobium sp. 32-5/1]|uniref:HNH endonuclease n=1 Tax=Rhizobium sp. 32-5/1 TaxID=3019602 RepID=UPI00240DFFE6|nr:HNH endonuclease signature motif containing protein [Rhizobium sp. 32-5/1]WEZ84817.1 HNH endonuclease signature motif containing protein [Rhizobium sp. 32-5/1]